MVFVVLIGDLVGGSGKVFLSTLRWFFTVIGCSIGCNGSRTRERGPTVFPCFRSYSEVSLVVLVALALRGKPCRHV